MEDYSTLIKVIIPKKRLDNALDAIYEQYKTRDIIQLFDTAMNLLQCSKTCKYNTISEKSGTFVFELIIRSKKYNDIAYVFFHLLRNVSHYCASNTVCGTYIDGEISDDFQCGVYCELGNRNDFVFNVSYKNANKKVMHTTQNWWIKKEDPLLDYCNIMPDCHKHNNSLDEMEDDLTADEGVLSSDDDDDDSTYYPKEDEDEDEDEDEEMSCISNVSEHDLSKIMTSIHTPIHYVDNDAELIMNGDSQHNYMSNVFIKLKNNNENSDNEKTDNDKMDDENMQTNINNMNIAHIHDIINTCINEHDASINISRSHLIQKLRNSLTPFQFSFNEKQFNNIINRFINNIIINNETFRKVLLLKESTESYLFIKGLKEISSKNEARNTICMNSDV
jgi:hypothetical protein